MCICGFLCTHRSQSKITKEFFSGCVNDRGATAIVINPDPDPDKKLKFKEVFCSHNEGECKAPISVKPNETLDILSYQLDNYPRNLRDDEKSITGNKVWGTTYWKMNVEKWYRVWAKRGYSDELFVGMNLFPNRDWTLAELFDRDRWSPAEIEMWDNDETPPSLPKFDSKYEAWVFDGSSLHDIRRCK